MLQTPSRDTVRCCGGSGMVGKWRVLPGGSGCWVCHWVEHSPSMPCNFRTAVTMAINLSLTCLTPESRKSSSSTSNFGTVEPCKMLVLRYLKTFKSCQAPSQNIMDGNYASTRRRWRRVKIISIWMSHISDKSLRYTRKWSTWRPKDGESSAQMG